MNPHFTEDFPGATVLTEREIPFLVKAIDEYGSSPTCPEDDDALELLDFAEDSWAFSQPYVTFSQEELAVVLRAVNHLQLSLDTTDARYLKRSETIASLYAKLAKAKAFEPLSYE